MAEGSESSAEEMGTAYPLTESRVPGLVPQAKFGRNKLVLHNRLEFPIPSSFAGGGVPFSAAHRIEFAIALTMAEAQVKNRFAANLCKSGEPRLDSHSSEDTLQHMQI